MQRGNLVAPAALALVIIAGCGGGGKVHSFTVSKQFVCPAESVTVSWKATGKTTLTAEPPVNNAQLGDVPEEGSREVALSASTTFILKAAKSGGTTTRKQEVALGEGRDQPIGEEITSCDDAAGVSTSFEMAAEDWDDRLRISSIDASATGRPLTVEHAGKTVDLGPQAQTSNALAGEKMSGKWVIRSPLQSGEKCGVPQSGLPSSLSIKVRVGCAAGGPP